MNADPLLRQSAMVLPYVQAGAVRLPCPAIDHVIALMAIGLPIGEPEVDFEALLDEEAALDARFVLESTDTAIAAGPLAGGEDVERRWMIARLEWADSATPADSETVITALCRMHDQIVASQTEAIREDMPTDKQDDGPGNAHGPRLMPGTRCEWRAVPTWTGNTSGECYPTQ